jgi:multiple antibiotic resistance protein
MRALAAFLLAFPALFSIMNPVGGALIFNGFTAHLAHADRLRVARRVGAYSLMILLGALWGGAYILNFFGVTLGALRIAGGAVVALSAWGLLTASDQHPDRSDHRVDSPAANPLDMAFFPLTLPITAGPGTIAVAITLGAERPASGIGLVEFFVGVTGAAAANAALVWLSYGAADRMATALSPTARMVLARLVAFLLLCVGVQILVGGITDVFAHMPVPPVRR